MRLLLGLGTVGGLSCAEGGAPALPEPQVDDCEVRVFFVDADGDGYGDGERAPVMRCAAPTGWVADGTDCADDDDTVFPGAPEVCDGRDDDCDGLADDGLVILDTYPDADGDGYGDENARPTPSCGVLPGRVANALDCNDGTPHVSPVVVERCNGIDEDCDGVIDDGLGEPRIDWALRGTVSELDRLSLDDVAELGGVQLELGEPTSVGRVDVSSLEGLVVDSFDVEIHDGTGWVFVQGVSGNTDARAVVTFPSVLTDRLRVTHPPTPPNARIDGIEVYANQAGDASVSGSSTSPGYDVSRTVDGDRTATPGGASSWTNEGPGTLPATLVLDFDECRRFERVELFSTASYEIADYDVEIWDGAGWVVLARTRGNGSSHVVHDGLSVYTERVRVVVSGGPDIQPGYARINEIELY
ncbi:MAG: hypothetical protein KTR31_36510 [Myxococcales bacterium]|nr:hypothetical protein [Myxococcales bacterium]